MPFAKINGLNLNYEVHGKGDPLVCISGFSCAANHWAAVLEELSRHHQVVIFDNRGVGQTDTPDSPYSIEMMAADTLALMDHLGISAAHIMGHSMGGCIAQYIAFHHSQRIKRLLLCNTLIKMNGVSRAAQKSLLRLRQDGVPLQRLIEAVMPWIFSNEFMSNDTVVQGAVSMMLNNPYPQSTVGVKRQLEALLAFDSGAWFDKIHLPTLVVGGEEDILCPHDSERIAKGIPSAQFVSMPGMAHLPMIERPEEFNRIVMHFLKQKCLEV